MNRNTLINQLQTYQTVFEEEHAYKTKFLDLLSEPNCFLRSNLERHFTASAWILNHDMTHTLLIHHAKLNKWLQPGGHADGDENIQNVALKEAQEETGIIEFDYIHPTFFDIDIHLIPARKEIAAHYHYDFRFLFKTTENVSFSKNHESTAIDWIPLTELHKLVNDSPSIMRMANKTKDFKIDIL